MPKPAGPSTPGDGIVAPETPDRPWTPAISEPVPSVGPDSPAERPPAKKRVRKY